MHAYTADFLCVVVSVRRRAALRKGFLGKGSHAARRADFTQTLHQVECRKGPALTLLFCMFLCGSPQPDGMCSSQSPSESFMFHYLQMGRGSKLTNREGSFSLISLWSPAWFWNVCSGSDWMSLILEHKNLSYCFLPSFLLSFICPFSLSFCPLLLSCCICLQARLPSDGPLAFLSSGWHLFVLLTLRFVPNRC